jgi:hypothetical protein
MAFNQLAALRSAPVAIVAIATAGFYFGRWWMRERTELLEARLASLNAGREDKETQIAALQAKLKAVTLAPNIALPARGLQTETNRQSASPGDLLGKSIRGLTFRLTDLPLIQDTIRDRTFDECDIYGPAIIFIVSPAEFTKCHFHGDPELMFWMPGPGQKGMLGAIAFQNCIFRRCRLIGIGFTGDREVLEFMRTTIGIHEDNGQPLPPP